VIDIEQLYFKWLTLRVGNVSAPLERLCWMLHQNSFQRRVGNDVNRAVDGESLRQMFLGDYAEADIDPRLSNALMAEECSWFEMLVALSSTLDYYYDGGVKERLFELITNMGLRKILFSDIESDGTSRYDEVDQDLVDIATRRIDENRIESNGYGGLFPLEKHDHPDQRGVEIWEQGGAYFRERLEGVMWTSTS
jgi:hypothetical protein